MFFKRQVKTIDFYAGAMIAFALLSEKHLPAFLVALVLFLTVLLTIRSFYDGNIKKKWLVAIWILLWMSTLSLFSPIDLRIRQDGLVGIHFLPVTYVTGTLSNEEFVGAMSDSSYSLESTAKPHQEVEIYRQPFLNQAKYCLVIDLP